VEVLVAQVVLQIEKGFSKEEGKEAVDRIYKGLCEFYI